MSFRAKIILWSLVILALLVAIYLVLRTITAKPAPTPTTTGQTLPVLPLAEQPPTPTIKTMTPVQMETYKSNESIKLSAKNFAERFGSYSLLANFSNFDELKTAVTPSTWDWLQSYRSDLLKKTSADFVGLSTRVVASKIISSEADKASVLVSTQREETLTSSTKVSYRDLLVKLVLVNKQWLVDGAYWQ